MEALIRWTHPTLGPIPPAKFIPLAEKTAFILQIDEWVIVEACKQNYRFQQETNIKVPVSVNISARHFYESRLLDTVKYALEKTSLEAKYLQIEITEGTLIKSIDYAIDIIGELKSLGVLVSIDDFGTGYSSLSQLLRLPIHELKIDREFIRNIDSDTKKASMVKFIIDLAHNLNLKVVAEGVETEDELKYLSQINCDEIQGYLFSRPLAKEAFERFLQNKDRLQNTSED
jgi:FOG: EAL domain